MNTVTETLVKGALGASNVVAWRWDIDDRRIDWSAGAEELLGLPDIVLRSPELLMRAIHTDDLPLVSNACREALRRGAHIEARFRLMAAGGLRWLDGSGRGILDESGRPIAATGTLVDVTEECEAEEAILETLHDAQLVLGEIGARLWEFDAETGTIHYLSPPTGPAILEDEYAGGVSLSLALERLRDQDRSIVRDKLNQALVTGEPMSFETTVLDDHGVPHRVFVRGGRSSASPRRLSGVSIVLD